MNKVCAEILYVIVKQSKQRGGDEGFKLDYIKRKVNELRKLENEKDVNFVKACLQTMKKDNWLINKGKSWMIHPIETCPCLVKDLETARTLDIIVQIIEAKSKGDTIFSLLELKTLHSKKYPGLKENFIEKNALPKLMADPYPYVAIDKGKRIYYLKKESYYPDDDPTKEISCMDGEKPYIDLILKYKFLE